LELTNHFKQYAEDVTSRLHLLKKISVLDIGSNDGTLLKYFKNKEMNVLGIEPANEIAAQANIAGVDTIPEFFGLDVSELLKVEYGLFDVVTVNNLFANIDDLDDFVRSLLNVLAPNGVIIIESAYLPDMIDNLMFDFIYHEHLSCFSIFPLERFLAKYDLRLVDLQHVTTKGGSMRYYFASSLSDHKVEETVERFKTIEEGLELSTKKPYEKFNQRINACKNHLRSLMQRNRHKKIAGYGASATTTTLLYHFGIHEYLDFLVDDFSQKIGTYSPGYNLKVLESEEIHQKSIDIVLVIAWRYAEQIMNKHNHFKGTFIVPLPEIKVYTQ
jgi:SAM-dependent methyltransferase|tara:strand:+ start:21623 stop:22609 length:987 start_codon:yes stop_codon:yes gene_type:complete